MTIGGVVRTAIRTLALAGAIVAAPLDAAPILAAADLRPATDLSGQWRYSIDPYRSGLAGFHGEAPSASERRWQEVDVSAAMHADHKKLFEFDMDAAPVATLPSSWLTHAAEMRHYQGLVWYQRHFSAHPTSRHRAFLRFGAANYTAQVYLNGQYVGAHEGGFTPFALEVTGKLRDGDNQVTIGVDSTQTEASVPSPVTDWENYGGLTRTIRLIETSATFVDDAWVRMTRTGRIDADVHLDGAEAANHPVTLRIAGLPLALTGRTDASGNWHADADAPSKLIRWSPDRPQLYEVSVDAGDDHWRDRIGFRTIETRGAQILLNGTPIFLRGICLHEEEFGVSPTRAITPAAARALFDEVKNGLHGNFVRLAHYPHSEETLRSADEIGVLVWSEVPTYWRIAWSNPRTLTIARTMLRENILRDRNRAAVAIWSIANETPVTPERNAFLAALADDAHALDDTRPVAAALLTERTGGGRRIELTMNDPLAAKLDIMGINTYNGWYTPDALADVPDTVWHIPADKPLIFSEFGADAKAGFHDDRGDAAQKSSEEYQAAYYRATLAMAARVPTLAGMSPWILKDFRSPRRQNGWEQGWNRKGLVSETGQHKLAFDVLAADYARREAAGR